MLINQSAAMREAGDSDWGSGMSGLDDQLSRRGRSSECASVCCSSNEERCVALLLPHEVIMRVFSQLDYRDLIHCSLACKQWHSESKDLREGWREEYWEACSVRGLIHYRLREITSILLLSPVLMICRGQSRPGRYSQPRVENRRSRMKQLIAVVLNTLFGNTLGIFENRC
ncbi:hypothetical protein R1flu_021406 [Riccia fluitans]|uniref:F-box domain-containing protein n=1 Tax=Riccia fluitans TaxID=41844 RepID=A0ABD1ZPA2_9MARC